MMRSPTIPNPVPCTIWPASHPAIAPTSRGHLTPYPDKRFRAAKRPYQDWRLLELA
jgi:hypothetical protein